MTLSNARPLRAGGAPASSQRTGVSNARAPFNDSNADVVLRSSDLVDFRTYKMILSMASPVFKDMFTLPQPISESTAESARASVHSGRSSSTFSSTSSTLFSGTSSSTVRPSSRPPALPVVRLTEDRKTLRCLLTAICPFPTEIPDSYDGVLAVLAAAQKYEMEGALADFRALTKPDFDTLPSTSALRVFGLACHYKLREEASVAAWHTLGMAMSLESYDSELKFVTGSGLYELMQYRRACEAAVHSLIKTIRNSVNYFIKDASQHSCMTTRRAGVWPSVTPVVTVHTPKWWLDHWNSVLDGLKSGRIFPTARSTIDQLSFQDSLRREGRRTYEDRRSSTFSLLPEIRCTACQNLSSHAVDHFCKEMQGYVEGATRQVRLNFDGI